MKGAVEYRPPFKHNLTTLTRVSVEMTVLSASLVPHFAGTVQIQFHAVRDAYHLGGTIEYRRAGFYSRQRRPFAQGIKHLRPVRIATVPHYLSQCSYRN